MLNLAQKVMLVVTEIIELYLDETDKRPWAVAWSGGKDSTTVMKMVATALQAIPKEKRWRRVYAVMSDTRMENPELERYMHTQVARLNDWAKREDMLIEVHVVSRKPHRSFFYLVLGKGYPLPNSGKNRWCTHSLKIEPQDEFIKSVDPALVLLGVRSDESSRRAASIENWRESADSRFGTHYSLKNIRTYMPIVHLTTEEVWEILLQPLPWSETVSIRALYKEATGECALINPEKATELANACGARFGCWTCPPINKDKSTENMAKVHEWMEPLTIWRSLLKQVYKKGSQYKSGFMRNGKYLGEGAGNLSIPGRKFLLDALLETQKEVNILRSYYGLDKIVLIPDEEVQMIRDQWEIDAKEMPWLQGGWTPEMVTQWKETR